MRLSDLNPKLSDSRILRFDCPTCRDHGIRIPITGADPNKNGFVWAAEGEFPDTVTLTPSVDAGCWHGFICNGEVTSA